MVNRLLVTSPNEQTWGNGQSILFVDEWCKPKSKEKLWRNYDFDVVPYHWNDRQRLYEDYIYLADLYEHILEQIAQSLNDYHKKSYSRRYWRIVIGPWLYYSIQIIFDRWQMMTRALEKAPTAETYALKLPFSEWIPHSFQDFHRSYLTYNWNHWLCTEVLQFLDFQKIHYIDFDQTSIVADHLKRKKLVDKLAARAKNVFVNIYPFKREKDYFFVASYLEKKQQTILEYELGQKYRKVYSPSIDMSSIQTARERFQFFHKESSSETLFDKFLQTFLCHNIPICYLEGFKEMQRSVKKVRWPRNPRLIFTSNAVIPDDFFKIWAAEKVETGSKLVVSQHGGNYGSAKFMANEDHELKIADNFFSWGWGDSNIRPNPSPILEQKVRKLSSNSEGYLYLVQTSNPEFSHWLFSAPLGGQFEQYFRDQLQFAQNLDEKIRKQLIVRLYPFDHDWMQKQRWDEQFPDVNFDQMDRSIDEGIQGARLYIGAHNTTT
ncbi:MAG: LIC12162 family protein, partial [Gammaproteobacteria bacterium]|nr:LIC12162 family protein [Gammaproteobacteria bacterium]